MNKITFNIVILIAIFLSNIPVKSQPFYTAWEKRYDMPLGSTIEARAVAVDTWGNIIFAANIEQPQQIGGQRVRQIQTTKYDPAGNVLWTVKSPSTNGVNQVNDLKTDAAGNVYVAGRYYNLIPGVNSNQNGFITKYNSSGVQQWSYVYDGTSGTDTTADGVSTIDVDTDGNVYFGGYSVVAGVANFLTAKISSSAVFEWKALIPTPPGENPYAARSIVIDNLLQRVYAAGWKNIVCYAAHGTELWRNYSGDFAKVMLSAGNLYLGSTSPHHMDIYKLNPLTGDVIWTVFRSAYTPMSFYNVDKAGNVFACVYDSLPHITPGVYDSIRSKLVILKYNPAGVLQWERNSQSFIISHGASYFVGVETDDSLNVYIATLTSDRPAPVFQSTRRLTSLAYDKNGTLLQENNYVPIANNITLQVPAYIPVAVNKNSFNFYLLASERVSNVPNFLIINFRSTGLLPAPSSLTAQAVSSQRINLNWQYNASEPAGFIIERSLFNCSDYVNIDSVPGNVTSYADTIVGPGAPYCYRVCAYTNSAHSVYSNSAVDTTFEIVGIANNPNVVPTEYKLYQNYPNPFNPATNISFDLPRQGFVTLKVYDVLGKQAAELVNGLTQAGSYKISWDASAFPSGIYFYKLQTENFIQVRRMILIK